MKKHSELRRNLLSLMDLCCHLESRQNKTISQNSLLYEVKLWVNRLFCNHRLWNLLKWTTNVTVSLRPLPSHNALQEPLVQTGEEATLLQVWEVCLKPTFRDTSLVSVCISSPFNVWVSNRRPDCNTANCFMKKKFCARLERFHLTFNTSWRVFQCSWFRTKQTWKGVCTFDPLWAGIKKPAL